MHLTRSFNPEWNASTTILTTSIHCRKNASNLKSCTRTQLLEMKIRTIVKISSPGPLHTWTTSRNCKEIFNRRSTPWWTKAIARRLKITTYAWSRSSSWTPFSMNQNPLISNETRKSIIPTYSASQKSCEFKERTIYLYDQD